MFFCCVARNQKPIKPMAASRKNPRRKDMNKEAEKAMMVSIGGADGKKLRHRKKTKAKGPIATP